MWRTDEKTSFGYGCVNFSPDDENSCRFSIGTIAGKTLPVTAVKQLLTDGHTDNPATVLNQKPEKNLTPA